MRTMEQLAHSIFLHPDWNFKYKPDEILDMREWIKSPYNSRIWSTRVDKMPDKQVIAIFRQMAKSGRFEGAILIPKPCKNDVKYHQMTLWDWIFDKSEPIKESNT